MVGSLLVVVCDEISDAHGVVDGVGDVFVADRLVLGIGTDPVAGAVDLAAGDPAAAELLTDLCETMKDGSLCALGGFTPFPVMSALRHFPDDFATRKEAAE
mgnify:CR=1 FL=1